MFVLTATGASRRLAPGRHCNPGILAIRKQWRHHLAFITPHIHTTHLAAEIGKSDDKIQIKMLKDCGATDSLLDINEYKRLKTHKNIHITIVNLKMVTPNATTENAIQGEVILEMTLYDITGRQISYNWTFLLADLGGRQKCILGYDFLSREDIIIGETPRHLFLKNEKGHLAIEILKCSRNDDIAKPLSKFYKQYNVLSEKRIS